MIGGAILPTALAADIGRVNVSGVDKGVSWKPVVPMKRTTFVASDDECYLDDYAYLAAVPTSIFYDSTGEQIFSNPLLFYQDEMIINEDKERSLDARQGINYFMEDWMSYCNGYLDQMTLINVPKHELEPSWKAHNYTVIEGDDPFEIAGDLALHDWSYSNDAIVAVIEETYDKPEDTVEGLLEGSLPRYDGVLTEHFEIPKTNEMYQISNEFTVPEGYKFMKVRSWYPSFYLSGGLPLPGFENVINMTIPAGDRDLQIYCNYDGRWMMAGITSGWNAREGMDHDKSSVYVYKSGRWVVALTDAPTKSFGSLIPIEDTRETGYEVQKHRKFLTFNFGRYGTFGEVLRNLFQVTYQVDVEMYPGTVIDIPDIPTYGVRNAEFNLKWDDSSAQLGFSLIGPSGEEVLSTREEGVSSKCFLPDGEVISPYSYTGTEHDMHIERLGECLPGEHYSICVFAMNDIKTEPTFTLEYSWEHNMTRQQGDNLASATEGAILASILNAPLLYTRTADIPSVTTETLNKLGVENIYLINIGDYLSSNAKQTLQETTTITKEYTTYEDIYNCIRDRTGRNDIIFSTVDPWTYWYVAELKPEEETKAGLFIGPAAYIAAHHGSPVLLIDNHPELSTSVVWHNELWQRHPDGFTKLPTVSEMYLTVTRIYEFLKAHGYDKEGEETIVTLAGQFDIGLPWDRLFVGKAKPGRFLGSPTDISVWLAKTVFYPEIIFENPVFKNPGGVTLINGSSSKRRPILSRGQFGLVITKPEEEKTFRYPVLDTLICYDHKFNSRASKYWGFEYKCADGSVPGRTASTNRIDEGVMEAVNGQKGAFFPDLSGSEVQPFYLTRAGYDPVFSTNFQANMYNLNQGVLLWLINTHGGPFDGGLLMFWDVEFENPRGYPPIPGAGYNKEPNPWRGYEWLLGSTEEPDTMTSEIHGILPAIMGNPTRTGIFTTALDWAAAKRPIRDIIGKLLSLPIINWFVPEWIKDTEDYYDGVIITVFLGRFGTTWYDGYQIDDAIGNIHSTGVSSVACLPAGKYLHLTLMRHGSVFQIMDPWATSWYSDVWQNSVPRGIALGQTIGEIYAEGISKVGILYISEDEPQWWWDLAENVCLYGDPDLRIWVPSTEYSTANHWEPEEVQPLRYDEDEGFSIAGHTPFGATGYPYARMPEPLWIQYALFIVIILVIIAILFVVYRSTRKKK
jgi:hypothetical protein